MEVTSDEGEITRSQFVVICVTARVKPGDGDDKKKKDYDDSAANGGGGSQKTHFPGKAYCTLAAER